VDVCERWKVSEQQWSGGDEQDVHGDALHLFIGQGKPCGLDTATAMVEEVAVSGSF
jgi:hypothetical protein